MSLLFRSRNDRNLTLYPDKYEGGTIENAPLIIKNVTREDMGEYTCMCMNSVGSERSEDTIFVNVLCKCYYFIEILHHRFCNM